MTALQQQEAKGLINALKTLSDGELHDLKFFLFGMQTKNRLSEEVKSDEQSELQRGDSGKNE